MAEGPSYAVWTLCPKSVRSCAVLWAISSLSSTMRTRAAESPPRSSTLGPGRLFGLPLAKRQPYGEDAPLAGRARHRNAAAVHLDQRADQSEADAKSALGVAARPLDLGEDVEHAGQHGGRNADAVIAHRDDHLMPLSLDLDPDAPAGFRVLGGVVQQVHHDLLQPGGVRIEAHGLLGERDRKLVLPVVDDVADDGDRAGNDRPEFHRLFAETDLALRDAGDIEQVIDQAGEVLDLAFDDLFGPGNTIPVASCRTEQIDSTADRGKQVPELVGEHRQKFILAAVGVLEFDCSLLEGLFKLPLFCHIAEDFEISAGLPGVILERHDEPVRPEPLSAFPNVPALVQGLAVGRGLPHLLFGFPSLTVRGREDDFGVRSDDLGLGVAENLLGSQVPGCDHSLHVEREDRKARGTLDDEAVTFPALAELGPDPPAFGDVVDGEEDESGVPALPTDLAAIEEHPPSADGLEGVVHLEVVE